MGDQKKKIIKFEEIRKEIVSALEERKISINESVTLLDGFVNEPFGKELSDSIVLGGPTIPMVMLIGNESGQVYFFALKAILKNIEL